MAHEDAPVSKAAANENSKSPTKSPSKAGNASPNANDPEDVRNHENEDEGSDANEGDEEEYEIEAILKAEKGRYEGGEMGYYVSWKGYTSEENCWIPESDAVNAQALIDEFWEKKKAEKKKKPVEPRPAVKGRKSLGKDAPESTQKKRGRKSKGMESDREDNGSGPSKKKFRNGGNFDQSTANPRPPASNEQSTSDEPFSIGDMKKFMSIKSWEHVVGSIDTVERSEEGILEVYFRLTTGERVKENSTVCAERFPQKLIKFYESNLRWKVSDGPEESVEV